MERTGRCGLGDQRDESLTDGDGVGWDNWDGDGVGWDDDGMGRDGWDGDGMGWDGWDGDGMGWEIREMREMMRA